MLSIKNGKNGEVYYKFEAGLTELAKALFPKVAEIAFSDGSIDGLLPTPKQETRSLKEIKEAVEGVKQYQPTLQLNIPAPSPDFSVYVKKYISDESKQMTAYRKIYAELYARFNINISKELEKLRFERSRKPHGKKGPQIWKSDIVRLLNINDKALEIAKEVVKDL